MVPTESNTVTKWTAIFLSSVKLNICTLNSYRVQGIKELWGNFTLSHDIVWHIINIQCARRKKWNEHNYTYSENLWPLTEVKLTSFKLRKWDSPPRIWQTDLRAKKAEKDREKKIVNRYTPRWMNKLTFWTHEVTLEDSSLNIILCNFTNTK